MKDGNNDQIPEFAKIRLFVEDELKPSARIALNRGQAHYLRSVMRRNIDDVVRLFNGRDGEWSARILSLGGECRLELVAPTRPQDRAPDVTLAFAPIKRSALGYLVEKATELGAARLKPVITAYTQAHHLNSERLRAHAIEAAEQSFRLSVPAIDQPIALGAFLAGFTGALLYCNERLAVGSPDAVGQLSKARNRAGPWTVLIGPEGGFAPDEQALIASLPNVVAISLGPRIVRAETAAVMALTLWQAVLGDLQTG